MSQVIPLVFPCTSAEALCSFKRLFESYGRLDHTSRRSPPRLASRRANDSIERRFAVRLLDQVLEALDKPRSLELLCRRQQTILDGPRVGNGDDMTHARPTRERFQLRIRLVDQRPLIGALR